MKKISKSLFVFAIAFALLSSLSTSAFAASKSFHVAYEGYRCTCYISISTSSASASLNCTPVPGELYPMDPEVAVDLIAFSESGIIIARASGTGIESASTSATWSSHYVGYAASCDYMFKGACIKTLTTAA